MTVIRTMARRGAPLGCALLLAAALASGCSDSSGGGGAGGEDDTGAAPDTGGTSDAEDDTGGPPDDDTAGGEDTLSDDTGSLEDTDTGAPDVPPADPGPNADTGPADVPAGETDTGPIVPDSGYPSGELMIKIVSPGGGPRADVIGAKTTVGGILFGDADTVSWQSSSGASGVIQEGVFWTSGPIDLAVGDNLITVVAAKGDKTATDRIVVTYNPAFRFDDFPSARPDVVWVGSTQTVVFTIPVSLYPNFVASTVTLLEVDQNGNTVKTEGKMVDDGNTGSTGDEIQGDGVFTRKASVACSAAGPRYYRVSVQVQQGPSTYTAVSPSIPVHCVEHFTPTECNSHLAILQQAESQVLGGAAGADVAAAIAQNPQVKSAGVAADGGYSLWVQFQSGVLGAVLLAPQGTRGAGEPFDPPSQDAFTPLPMVGGNVVDIGSKKAIVLAPFASEFGVTEDGPSVATALATSDCPSFTLEGGSALQGPAAKVDWFRRLPDYGIISVSSHGEALFGGVDPADKAALYGWDHAGAQEVLWTGEAVKCNELLQTNQTCSISSSNPTGGCPAGTLCVVTSGSGGSTSSGVCVDRTQADLRLGRLVLSNKGYAVTPSFVEAYAARGFANSLVNLGACRTMYNGTLVGAFFARGAKAISGFSGYVESAWAKERVVELFEGSVGQGLVGNSHAESEDPSHPGSWWRLFGAGNLDLSNSEIINASFETGDPTGWSRDGDGRVISQLGGTTPVAGKFMGLLSTGLGFTVQTGTLEQDFCIPGDKNTVEMYWKFYSEEFKEYCGSGFQDTFQAVLLGAGGQLTIVDVKVDDMCGYQDGSCLGCPQPIACDWECAGGAGCTFDPTTQTCSGSYPCECGKFFKGLTPSDVSFDQGGVFNTLWIKAKKNVKALAGAGKVTLRLFSSDTGDSIFDTVVLIDAIQFK